MKQNRFSTKKILILTAATLIGAQASIANAGNGGHILCYTNDSYSYAGSVDFHIYKGDLNVQATSVRGYTVKAIAIYKPENDRVAVAYSTNGHFSGVISKSLSAIFVNRKNVTESSVTVFCNSAKN